MLSAISEDVPLGKPHVHHDCHLDDYVAQLDVSIDCTLTQGFEVDEETGERRRKPVGVIHLGEGPDPVMVVKVGLRGALLHHLCGKLCVRVHLECIGTGPEVDLPNREYRLPDDVYERPIEGDDDRKCCDSGSNDWCYYKFRVTIPREIFDEYGSDCGEFCCFATTVTSRDRCGNPGHIGCWCKGPCVMIHQAPEN